MRIQQIWQYKKVTISAYSKEIKVIVSSGFQAKKFFTVLKCIKYLIRYSISISKIFNFLLLIQFI